MNDDGNIRNSRKQQRGFGELRRRIELNQRGVGEIAESLPSRSRAPTGLRIRQTIAGAERSIAESGTQTDLQRTKSIVKKSAVTVLSESPGAGMTTLLNRALPHRDGLGAAVTVNDMSEGHRLMTPCCGKAAGVTLGRQSGANVVDGVLDKSRRSMK